MVTFVCFHCDKTLKKPQVDKHVNHECRRYPKLCCIDCRKWFEGDAHKAHTSCMTEAEAYQGKLYNPKIKNKDLVNKDIPTIDWIGWKRTIRKLVKMEDKKVIDKKVLKERVLASFKKYKKDDFDSRDANVKFLLKCNKTKNLKVSGNKIIYDREE